MPLEINILVGTMTNTSQLVAQEIELTADDDDTKLTVTYMDGLDASAITPSRTPVKSGRVATSES